MRTPPTRDKQIVVRVAGTDKEAWRRAAAELGVEAGTWIYQACQEKLARQAGKRVTVARPVPSDGRSVTPPAV